MASSLLWAGGRRRQTPQCRFVIFVAVINNILLIMIIVITITLLIEIVIIMTMQPTFIAPWSKSKEIKRARRLVIMMLMMITMMLMMMVIQHQNGDDEYPDSEDHHDVDVDYEEEDIISRMMMLMGKLCWAHMMLMVITGCSSRWTATTLKRLHRR